MHILKRTLKQCVVVSGWRTHFFHKDERVKFMKSDLSVAGTISCWNSMVSTIIQSHWNGWGFDTQTKKFSKVNVSAQSQLWFGITLSKPTVLRSLDSLENHVMYSRRLLYALFTQLKRRLLMCSPKNWTMIHPTLFSHRLLSKHTVAQDRQCSGSAVKILGRCTGQDHIQSSWALWSFWFIFCSVNIFTLSSTVFDRDFMMKWECIKTN